MNRSRALATSPRSRYEGASLEVPHASLHILVRGEILGFQRRGCVHAGERRLLSKPHAAAQQASHTEADDRPGKMVQSQPPFGAGLRHLAGVYNSVTYDGS